MPLLRRQIRPRQRQGHGGLRRWHWLWRGPLLALGLYLLAGTLGGLIRVGQPDGGGGPTIFLLSGPIHTDLVLPSTPALKDWFAFLARDGIDFGDWLIVGWGARDFYTTTGSYSDLRPGAVLKAVTGDRSVMRVQPIGPFTPHPDMTPLALSEAEYDRLLEAVRGGFDGTEPQRLNQPGQTGGDHFYAGAGRFHILRTCNVWVAEMLDEAGIRFGRWTPTAYAVTLSLAAHQP